MRQTDRNETNILSVKNISVEKMNTRCCHGQSGSASEVLIENREKIGMRKIWAGNAKCFVVNSVIEYGGSSTAPI
jgi:hypothetical protein